MAKVLLRDPIHIGTAHRGKLRKVEHHKINLSLPHNNLILTPTNILTQFTIRKPKHHSYYRKQDEQLITFGAQISKSKKQRSGAFRAIHTAQLIDSLRGFPLRSVTPIRPFRRGICSNQESGRIQVPLVKQTSFSIKFPRKGTPSQANLGEAINKTGDEAIKNEEEQQFYKYNPLKDYSNDNCQGEETPRKIAGTKIQPFKKYQIRQIHRNNLSMRNHQANPILDE